MEGETVRLLMDIAFRAPEANALFEHGCRMLQGNAALQVAGIQFRRESQSSFLGSLVLNNPSNYCYFNSAVRALLWSLAGDSRNATEAQASSCQWGLSTAGLQAYRFVASLPARPHFLPGMLVWNIPLRGWVRAHAQQDCAECLAFFTPRFCPQVSAAYPLQATC